MIYRCRGYRKTFYLVAMHASLFAFAAVSIDILLNAAWVRVIQIFLFKQIHFYLKKMYYYSDNRSIIPAYRALTLVKIISERASSVCVF